MLKSLKLKKNEQTVEKARPTQFDWNSTKCTLKQVLFKCSTLWSKLN